MELKDKLARLTQLSKKRFDQLERNKNIWIKEVNNLYKNVVTWFDDYVKEEYMFIDYEQLQHAECEEFFLNTNIMCLNLGGEQGPSVVFEPTGINIAGALGKIDLYLRGHRDENLFLLLIENDLEKLHWEVRSGKKQPISAANFTKETFEDILNEWLDKWTDL